MLTTINQFFCGRNFAINYYHSNITSQATQQKTTPLRRSIMADRYSKTPLICTKAVSGWNSNAPYSYSILSFWWTKRTNHNTPTILTAQITEPLTKNIGFKYVGGRYDRLYTLRDTVEDLRFWRW
jgi:hypothetical protein